MKKATDSAIYYEDCVYVLLDTQGKIHLYCWWDWFGPTTQTVITQLSVDTLKMVYTKGGLNIKVENLEKISEGLYKEIKE